MKLIIKIELDNAAFEDGGTEEINRILQDLCDRLSEPLGTTPSAINLHDINGNWVGDARIR